MHLPLADNIEPQRTRHRLPSLEPTRLGLYAEQEGHFDMYLPDREVWRTEVRIGAQTAINPHMPRDLAARVHKETKGQIMRHVYGPIYDELLKVREDLFNRGYYHDDPAFKRVCAMLDTLAYSFRGEC